MLRRCVPTWLLFGLIAFAGCASAKWRPFGMAAKESRQADLAQDSASPAPARLPPGIELPPPQPMAPSQTLPSGATESTAPDQSNSVIFAGAQVP